MPPLLRGDPPAYRHPPYQGEIPPPIGTPLIKGGRGDRT
ncbi:Glutamate N-acetyltransferase [Microcystis aeruginosa NIES-298]|nr:Glutamate N-acetyltransferase [Microcystis aeruginosa NIES-98]GBE97506.1 Glutamate N-acetyltransferase [Microcystis aeruginosa NIES-298]GBF00064.1 Glutamate N-acetyltransferase [Microcystis aeruginosa NIES-298]